MIRPGFLSSSERRELEVCVRSQREDHGVARRANAILLLDDGTLKWSCFLGQVCGLAKMHLVYVHAAFRVSLCSKYAASGVRLSRAV